MIFFSELLTFFSTPAPPIHLLLLQNDYSYSSDRVNARRRLHFLSAEDDGNDAFSRL